MEILFLAYIFICDTVNLNYIESIYKFLGDLCCYLGVRKQDIPNISIYMSKVKGQRSKANSLSTDSFSN